ncbi:MAG: anti-sigma factor family protein [Actinomycetes bacterium]
MTHLGDQVSALVDGELDHDARDRALAHLAGCEGCRLAVDEERRAKSAVRHLEVPLLPPSLTDRLSALPAELSAPAGLRAGGAWPTGPRRRPRSRRAAGPADQRPRGAARRRRRLATAATGVLAVTACAAALAVGGGTAGGRAVSPPVDRFGVEHAAVTPEVPLQDQGGPAVVVSFSTPDGP